MRDANTGVPHVPWTRLKGDLKRVKMTEAVCPPTATRMIEKPQSGQKLWIVEQRKLWGDYGDVLISGYARRETDEGPLSLHRTGPFLPPVSFPFITNMPAGRAVVLSAPFKQALEHLNLPGVTFG